MEAAGRPHHPAEYPAALSGPALPPIRAFLALLPLDSVVRLPAWLVGMEHEAFPDIFPADSPASGAFLLLSHPAAMFLLPAVPAPFTITGTGEQSF